MLTLKANQPLRLLEVYPRLGEAAPRLPIGIWPTPVTEARKFAAAHRLSTLYVKREDLCHPECAGNKVRGLEFLLADAVNHGAKVIVTFGTAGSHHIRSTAWHARQFGIETVAVVIDQPEAGYVRRNLLAGLEAGAAYVPANYFTLGPKFAVRLAREWAKGRRPYYVPPGGTNLLACLGHVSAAMELKPQIEMGDILAPQYLYVPLGSLGTAAGLLVGCKLAGLSVHLVGVVVSHRWFCTPGRWLRLARRVHRFMARRDPSVPDIKVRRSDVSVVATALGPGYARRTEESIRLAEEFRALEKIELDGTYTAKTLHGAMQFIEQQGASDAVHLFWHTYHGMTAAVGTSAMLQRLPTEMRHFFSSAEFAGIRGEGTKDQG